MGRGVERICLPARGLGAWEYQRIQVQMGKAKVTGLLDWEVAGYIPKAMDCHKGQGRRWVEF